METLDKHFRSLTREVFARYGFAYGELIARWPEIVGEALAPFCEPQRIRWPRGAGAVEQKSGGMLLITAAPGRALELQYEVPRIIERVNRFYGYGAITSVKINQGSISPRRRQALHPLPPAPERFSQHTAVIADPALKAALDRLAAGIASRSSSSPQGKE
jgi:hypothetical protein